MVRGCERQRAPRAKFLEQRDSKRGTFFRRRAGAHFVDENQRALGGHLEHRFQIQHVRGKRREVRRDGLLVADIRQHMVENRQFGAFGRHGNRGLRRKRGEPVVLSATVLPPVFGPLMTITVSPPPRANVSGTALRPCGRSATSSTGLRAASRRNESPAVNSGTVQSKSRAKRARAKSESRCAISAAAAWSGPRSSADPLRQLFQDARDFGDFFVAQLDQTVIEIDRFERLDENRLPRGARAVHYARNGAALGSAHRNHEAVVAERDVVFALFARGLAARAQDAFERPPNFLARLGNPGADALQLRRSIVADFTVRENCSVDRRGDLPEIGQRRSALGEARILCGLAAKRLPHTAHRFHQRNSLEQLGDRQHGSWNHEPREPRRRVRERAESQLRAGAQKRHRLAHELEFGVKRSRILLWRKRLYRPAVQAYMW